MTLLRKPVSIFLIGLYYMVSPLVNLVQIVFVTQLPLAGPVSVWTQLNPFDWAILVAFPVVGAGVFTVRRWGWLAFVSFSLFLIGYNSYAFLVNRAYDLAVVVGYNLALAVVTFVFFRRHFRAPYFNPRLRWWAADPRYPTQLSADVLHLEAPCEAEILDLSRSGVFLSTCAEVEVGQVLEVNVTAFGHSILCRGKVMRTAGVGSKVPGFGLMFEGMKPEARHEVRTLVARLVKDGARERGLPPDAPTARDPFQKHLVWYAKRLWAELVGA